MYQIGLLMRPHTCIRYEYICVLTHVSDTNTYVSSHMNHIGLLITITSTRPQHQRHHTIPETLTSTEQQRSRDRNFHDTMSSTGP